MKPLLIISIILSSLTASAQTGIWFTRAELEMAADSALKGQQSTVDKAYLIQAVRALNSEVSKRMQAQTVCDSVTSEQSARIDELERERNEQHGIATMETQKRKKQKPWAIIGKVGTATVAVLVGVKLFVTIKEATE